MPGESQREPATGQADPSVLSTEALQREVHVLRDEINARIEALRDVHNERFRSMDVATKVLHETVTRTPTDIQQAVGHLHELMNEKFSSVQTQFQERDTRQERESRDNKVAVDAAFAAQKEVAAKDGESNQKAIDKSERATNETIKTNSELSQSTTEALKERVQQLELGMRDVRSLRQGGTDQIKANQADASGNRQSMSVMIAAAALVGSLLLGVAAIVVTLLLR